MGINPFEKRVEEKKDPFLSRIKEKKDFEDQYQTPEETEREVDRNQAQFTSRAIEGIAGLPGDLINFAGGLFGLEPNVPGSQKLREFSEDITSGYTKPQNELEERVGETIQDMALFALPGAKHYSIARNIGIPVVSNLIKEGVKYTGAGEGKQAASKIGSMVLLDLLSHRSNLGSAKEYASSLFKQADEVIPKGLSIKATNLRQNLDSLEKSLSKGGSRPDTAEALTKIKELKSEISDKGFIDLKNLVAYRPSINSWIDKFKGFDIAVDPKIRNQIIHNLNQVKGEVIKSAEEYGKKYNPEYLKLSQSANEAYAAVQQSNKIKNFIEKKAGSKIQSYGLKALLGLGATGTLGAATSIAGLGVGAGAGATAAIGYKALKTILRSKSPVLRDHYFKILEGASKGNVPQTLKNINFLDKAFLEMEETGEFSPQESQE